MKMTLISPYTSVTMHNVRQLSACMRAAGHDVDLLWLPAYPQADAQLELRERPYPDEAMARVAEFCAGSDLIGISLMTDFLSASVQISRALKDRVKAPLIWGGFHPTFAPETSLGYADMVAVGEADESLVELAACLEAGRDPAGIPGIWVRRNGGIVKGPTRPWFKDLGALPIPDSDTHRHRVLSRDRTELVPLDATLTQYYMRSDAASDGKLTFYPVSTTRGCPYSCTFCGNSAYRDSGGNAGYVRKYPLDWVMRELKQGIRAYSPDFILFNDECLTCKKPDELQAFCDLYKAEVGLPFRGMATPRSVTPETMERLVDAGMSFIEVGVQTGSPSALKAYHREWSKPEQIRGASKILARHASRLTTLYDIILDNPYETRDDVLQTAWLMLDIARPGARFQIFSLAAYPGTELAKKMEADGFVDSGQLSGMTDRAYQQKLPLYANVLCSLAARRCPRWLFKLLASRIAFALLDRRGMAMLYASIYQSFHAARAWTKSLRMRAESAG